MAEHCGTCRSTDVSHGAIGLHCLTCGADTVYSTEPYLSATDYPATPAKKAAPVKKAAKKKD